MKFVHCEQCLCRGVARLRCSIPEGGGGGGGGGGFVPSTSLW